MNIEDHQESKLDVVIQTIGTQVQNHQHAHLHVSQGKYSSRGPISTRSTAHVGGNAGHL